MPVQALMFSQRIAAAPAPTDQFASSVVLLANGNSMTDLSGRHTIESDIGTVGTSSTGFIFGGGSSLQVTGNLADFNFLGDFTIEHEFTGTVAGDTYRHMLSNFDPTVPGSWSTYAVGSNGAVGIYGNANTFMEPASINVLNNAPRQYAHSFTYVDGISRLYIDGVLIESYTAGTGAANWVRQSAASLKIGREGYAADFWSGTMRVRITNGVARYTGASYTLPTWPLSL